jgi:hypothetical protein
MQATVVGHYGRKPTAFAKLLRECRDAVRSMFGPSFNAYEIDQIHGTLIGLEREDEHAGAYLNRNFRVLRGVRINMEFEGLLRSLQRAFSNSVLIQVGGFAPHQDSFRSRGLLPFERSFSIQGNKAVVMGWPVRSEAIIGASSSIDDREGRHPRYPNSLHRVRLDMQTHGVLHAYHAKLHDVDNDFYFRLGTIADSSLLTRKIISETEVSMRQWLSKTPLTLEIRLSDLCVAFYRTTELPRASTRTICISDGRCTGEAIRRGYLDAGRI